MAWVERYRQGYRGRYKDLSGSNRTASGSFATKSEALKAARDEEAKLRRGDWVDPQAGKITFSEYFETVWLPSQTKELSTVVSYESAYKRHYKPKFGDKQLRRILPSHVQGWVASLQKQGYAPSTIQKLFAQFQSILGGRRGSSALRDGLIAKNPCDGVALPPVPRRTVSIYTPDEVNRLLEAMDPWWRPIPILATETGMRWGELMGLQVEDFSIGMRSVRVCRTIVEVASAKTGNGTPFVLKPYPKSGRSRELALSPEVGQVMAEMMTKRKLSRGDRVFFDAQEGRLGDRRGHQQEAAAERRLAGRCSGPQG